MLNLIKLISVLLLGGYFLNNPCAGQVADSDTLLAHQIKNLFGDNVKVAAFSSTVTLDFSRIGSDVKATQITDERMISLDNNYNLVKGFGCDDFCDLSSVQVYDKKDQPVFTPVYDQSNEGGEIFYDDEKTRIFAIHFNKIGDKSRYKAQTLYTDMKFLDPIFFKDDYPIYSKTIIIRAPKWISLDIKDYNLQQSDITKTVTTDSVNGDKIYTYRAKNLKPIPDGEGEDREYSSSVPNILIACKSYVSPDGKTRDVLNTLADLYHYYEKLANEAGNDSLSLKPLVMSIIKDKRTDLEKIKAIYYWVEDNIRYLAFENDLAGLKPDACQNVVQKKYGDCKGMANLLTVMLRLAGFDARHTWLGTKGIAYDYSTPSLCDDNHCICTLFYKKKPFYLDATEQYASLGDNGDMIQGRQVLIEDGNEYHIEVIPPAGAERNKVEISGTMAINNDLLEGKAHYNYNGEPKTELLYEYNHVPADEKNDALKYLTCKKDANLSVVDITTSNLQDRDMPVSISYSFRLKNQVTAFDNDLYVAIDYDKKLPGPVMDSSRSYDYEFPYKEYKVADDTLLIPAGDSVKHLPDNLHIATDDYSFEITCTALSGSIVYHKEIKILHDFLPVTKFKAWNNAVKQLENTMEDQIVLIKP